MKNQPVSLDLPGFAHVSAAFENAPTDGPGGIR
jgi:hypothetical protein